MKSTFTSFAVLPLLLLIVSQSHAQFVVQGQFRPRLEYRYGYSQLPADTSDPALFISQRTRLSFNYTGKGIVGRVTLQDVRVWGDQQLKSTAPTVGLYETWIEVKLHDSLTLRLGRQELIYDNERVMSNNNWNQSGRVHDAAVMKATLNGWRLDVGAAWNQLQENTFGTNYDNSQASIKGNYKTMNFIWLAKSFRMFRLGLLGLADGFQKKGEAKTLYVRGTIGGSLTFCKKDIELTFRGYYQTGKTQEGRNILAYYLNPELTWNIKEKVLLAGGMEYVSGDNGLDTNDTKFRTFSVLYGTGHRFMGHMDYFTDMYRDTKGGGLVNLFLRSTWLLDDKFTLEADYNYFALQNNYVVNQKAIDKYLGSELDLNCNITFSKSVALLFGYSFMLGTTSMEYIKGGDKDQWSNWAFVMVTLKPTFFNSEK